MNSKTLPIGAYILAPYARTVKHIQEIKDCKIDFIVDMDYDKEALEIMSQIGVGAYVRGVVPGWWGGNGKSGQLKDINTLDRYERARSRFMDFPSILSISIGDEPSALDFEHYGKVYSLVDELFEKQFPYLNLYPNYATVAENTADETKSQLGTATYAQYIEDYCQKVSSPYISYDYYVYATRNVKAMLDNFRVVTDACKKYGREFWYIPQVNSNREDFSISENMLRFQAFCALSFGAVSITWACYTAGWWHNQVLDENGEKTEQYDKLRKINGELKTIGEHYMKYKNISTSTIGFEGESGSFSNDVVVGLCAQDAPLVIGDMKDENNSAKRALFITVADDYLDNNQSEYTLTFECKGRLSNASINGEKTDVFCDNGKYSLKVKSNNGVFLEIE